MNDDEKQVTYALWAPGVGYRTAKESRGELDGCWSLNLQHARRFRLPEDILIALDRNSIGTGMIGLEIRRIEVVLDPRLVDLGRIQ